MAVFKSLHFGESIRALRGVIRYNSVEKKGFNNDINPRLISVISNVGFCDDVNNEESYKRLTENLILDIEANSLLSTNKRQKYLYEHSTISFEREDDKKLGMEKLTELALKIANEANTDNAPQMLWPQIDSGKLHFHLVRGMHNENGVYQKKKNDFININKFIQKLEVDENLTLTGKNNPDNYVWKTVNGKKKKTYIPQGNNDGSKISKNKDIDYKIKIDKKGNIKYFKNLKKEIADDRKQEKALYQQKNKVHTKRTNDVSTLQNLISQLEQPVRYTLWQKHISNFSEIDIFERKEKIKEKKEQIHKINNSAEIKENDIYKQIIKIEDAISSNLKKEKAVVAEIKEDKKGINENEKKDKVYNDFRGLINNAYRSSKTAEMFLKTLNDNDIEACITYRKKNGGISFNSLNSDISMAGGKVNSYLTFGKIKKNDPDLFALLTGSTGFGEITLTNENQLNNDINIQEINKNYKQRINSDGSTSIFYNKKDFNKYPHNHNLKINAEKNKISFGQFSNDHDLKLAYSLAKQNCWTNAKSDNKELIQRSMAIAYQENKEDLFFFQTKEPTLKLAELKEIIDDDLLSKDNLIKLIDGNLINKDDKKEALVFVKKQLIAHKEDITIINSLLKNGHSLKKCIEVSEQKNIEQQEKIKLEVKRKEDNKTSIPKIIQEIEPSPKNKRRSGNRI